MRAILLATGLMMAQPVVAGETAGLRRWAEGFRERAAAQGIPAVILDAGLADLAYDPKIVERDRSQAEFTKPIWDYLDGAVSPERVANGQAALAAHADTLAAIEARYGVEKEIVVAIWGLESAYGAFRGDTPTLSALATLAYDGRRAAFFEDELVAALRIVAAGEVAPGEMRGSWAGAMGHTQFMPSSYLARAVDFDGDGRRAIWGDDPADALASTAAYLAGFGWTRGQPWGVEVRLPEGFDYAATGDGTVRPVAEWQAAGVQAAAGVLPDPGAAASVLLPAGAGGPAFLVYPNFRVIERYNAADAYVIAVGHLADRLRGLSPFRADWPRGDRVLTHAERQELQARLTGAGFDTRGVDGRIGPNTIAAIRAFQIAQGLRPDGYADLALLTRLR